MNSRFFLMGVPPKMVSITGIKVTPIYGTELGFCFKKKKKSEKRKRCQSPFLGNKAEKRCQSPFSGKPHPPKGVNHPFRQIPPKGVNHRF